MIRTWVRNMKSRATWKAAHRHYREATLTKLLESDDEGSRLYAIAHRRAYLETQRMMRALHHLVDRGIVK